MLATSVVSVNSQGPTAMQTALNSHILSVVVDASSFEFQMYKSGLFASPNCATSLDHTVNVVGWGTDSASGSDYWLVRNE